MDGGRDVLQLAAARTLDAVPAHRYEMALRVGDLEAGEEFIVRLRDWIASYGIVGS